MRMVARLIFGVAFVLVLTGGALYFLRKPIAEAAVERVMARAGFENPDVSVRDVTPNALTLSELKAGRDRNAPELYLRDTEFGYDPFDLVMRGKLRSLAVTAGDLTMIADAPDRFLVAGWAPASSPGGASPPLSSLALEDVTLRVRTPKGDAIVNIRGAFDFDAGGRFDLSATADAAGFELASFSTLEGRSTVTLAADGAVDIESAIRSDIAVSAGVARGVDATVASKFVSWRNLFTAGGAPLEGVARVSVKSSTIDADATMLLTPLIGKEGETGGAVELAGVIEAKFDQGGIAISAPEGPVSFIAAGAGRLTVDGGGGTLYRRRGEEQRISFRAQAAGPAFNGAGELTALSTAQSPWEVKAQARFDQRTIFGAHLSNFSGVFDGVYDADRLTGVADIDTLMKTVTIGRLRIFDAPIRGRLDTEIDFKDRRLSGSMKSGGCVDVARAQFSFFDQDMEARATDAKICANDRTFVSVGWGAEPLTRVEGVLTAKTAHYRLGKTVFDGAPPQIDFTLEYDPEAQRSRVVGDLSGGRVILNDSMILTNIVGDLDADFVRDTVGGKVSLTSMRLAQNARLEQIAPVSVSGDATLAEDIARFDFVVSTPKGVALGRGEGRHNVKTGVGESIFDSGVLTLSRYLKAEAVIPALQGIVWDMNGETEGRASLAWTPQGVCSAATVNFDDVSFRGPGVAVTRTEGVSGKLVLSNLAPVTTAGEQSFSIRKIDMDALKLENGDVRFALAGDETMKIIEAEFPWFDGTIGAYDSVVALSGGRSEVVLQIDNVNLAGLLAYPNVEGLSGEGVIEGVLPVSFEGGRARIVNGVLSAKGGGVIRYQNKSAEPAFQSNEQAQLAYAILREVKFDNLSVVIDGPLDGTLNFKIIFDGKGDIPVSTRQGKTSVLSPVILRLTMIVPLLKLIEGAKAASNPIQILKSAPRSAADQEKAVDDLIGENPDIF